MMTWLRKLPLAHEVRGCFMHYSGASMLRGISHTSSTGQFLWTQTALDVSQRSVAKHDHDKDSRNGRAPHMSLVLAVLQGHRGNFLRSTIVAVGTNDLSVRLIIFRVAWQTHELDAIDRLLYGTRHQHWGFHSIRNITKVDNVVSDCLVPLDRTPIREAARRDWFRLTSPSVSAAHPVRRCGT